MEPGGLEPLEGWPLSESEPWTQSLHILLLVVTQRGEGPPWRGCFLVSYLGCLPESGSRGDYETGRDNSLPLRGSAEQYVPPLGMGVQSWAELPRGFQLQWKFLALPALP